MNLKSNIIVSNYDISRNLPFIKKRPAKRGFPRRKYFGRYSLQFKVQIHACHRLVWVDLHKAWSKSLRKKKSIILSKGVTTLIFIAHITTVPMQTSEKFHQWKAPCR